MLRFAIANLLSRPGRTALSVLGLTIAIAGMVGLFSIAGGIDSLMDSSFGEIDGVVVLQNGAPIPLFSTLPAEWGAEMAEIDGVNIVNPELWSRANLIDGEAILSPPRLLFGTDLPTRVGRLDGTIRDDIEEGHFLGLSDVGTNHAVISRQIAEQFEKTIGDRMEVNGQELEIVGIYHSGSILIDVTIVVDITLLREMIRAAPDAVSAFYIEPDEGISNDLIVERIKDRFRDRKLPAWQTGATDLGSQTFAPQNLGQWISAIVLTLAAPPEPVEDFPPQANSSAEIGNPSDRPDAVVPEEEQDVGPIAVRSVVEWGEQFQDLTADLNIILALLTGLGIAIAVSSILNTMLMSVTERIVEFGILRANGWSQGDVVRLITCEAAVLGGIGGVLGVAFGWIATLLINGIWTDRVHLYAGPLLLSFSLLFAIVIGTLGGCYPALRAARLSPMDAIRQG